MIKYLSVAIIALSVPAIAMERTPRWGTEEWKAAREEVKRTMKEVVDRAITEERRKRKHEAERKRLELDQTNKGE